MENKNIKFTPNISFSVNKEIEIPEYSMNVRMKEKQEKKINIINVKKDFTFINNSNKNNSLF